MKTKKILVPIDIQNQQKIIKGILFPELDGENFLKGEFTNVSSNKKFKYGLVVLKGGGYSTDLLFKDIVDSGRAINNVQKTYQILNDYIVQINDFKIGDIIYIEQTCLKTLSLKKYIDL